MASGKHRSPVRWLLLVVFGVVGGLITVYFLSVESPASFFATAPSVTATAAPSVTETPTESAIASASTETADIPVETRLLIPSAGVSAPIVQVYPDGYSWDITNLGANVGHLKGTAWLPATGNVVLLGHVELGDGRKGVFASIKDLKNGDLMIVETVDGNFRYQVSNIFLTDPTDLTPLYPQATNRLTLITCDDYDFLTNVYRKRLIVVAEQMA